VALLCEGHSERQADISEPNYPNFHSGAV
jgi:hypothetical protein